MSTVIAGIGTWLPERVRGNDAWPEGFGARSGPTGDRTFNDIPAPEDPIAASILERDLALEGGDPFLGAHERRVADPSVTAADAETLAARAALADAGIPGSDVDLVISYSMVPDRVAPACCNAVAHRIGAAGARAYGVEVACASSVAQLEIACAYLDAGLAKVVLVTQSHLLTRALSLPHPASPGLGDAASAFVLAKAARGLAVRSVFAVTHGEYLDAVTWVRAPDDPAEAQWWNAGGDYRLGSLAPPQVKLLMRDTVAFGAATVRSAAERAGVDVERLSALASVQPRGFIPGAIAARLGLPRACAPSTYSEIAHIGACGVAFNLARARERGMLQPGKLAALYAQGAGFTRAAAVLEVV